MLILSEVAGEALSGVGMGVRLAFVLFLVLANGFFVAAEFALVAVRSSRIDELAFHGDRGARVVQTALKNLDRYISATQLGITVASLALGWIGEPALAALMDGLFAWLGIAAPSAVSHSAAAITIAFLIITFMHIVLGELAPKSVALAKAEAVSKVVARPLMLFSTLAYPLTWVLNGASNRLLRALGVQPASERELVHSPEELRLLVMHSREHGTLNEADTAMLAGVFDFHDKKARDVMRPRTEIVALSDDATEDEVWQTVRKERYSRYPVYRESLDDVVGVFLAKDLWLHPDGKSFALAEYLRPAVYVPDNRRAERVLDDLRKRRAHLAVVLDEYAGTAGIITLEDLIEEVIGDINDEYDFATKHAMESNGVLELSGALSLVDVRSDYQLHIPDGDWNTLGGFVFGQLGRVAHIGDRVQFPGGDLEVVAMGGRRVAAVRVVLSDGASKKTDAVAPVVEGVHAGARGGGAAAAPAASDSAFSDREVPL